MAGTPACCSRRPAGTLLCGDLFTHTGNCRALTDQDIVAPALAAEDSFQYTSLCPSTAPAIRRLADLAPRKLAVMHGSSFEGDGAAALRNLAGHYDERLRRAMGVGARPARPGSGHAGSRLREERSVATLCSSPTEARHERQHQAVMIFKLEVVHPDPSQAHKMPYAPAIKIVGACDLMFLSGATASPLYHNHPHQDHEHVHPHSIEDQTKNAMEAIKSILDSQGCTWRDVIKVTKYLTDFREADAMHKTMAKYFGDWLPASTTVCINQLSSPGARIELDMIVALPKSAGK